MTDATDPVVFSDAVTFTWPGHVFPTGKYKALADRLLYEQVVSRFLTPEPATREQLLTAHHEEYLEELEGMIQQAQAEMTTKDTTIDEVLARYPEIGAENQVDLDNDRWFIKRN